MSDEKRITPESLIQLLNEFIGDALQNETMVVQNPPKKNASLFHINNSQSLNQYTDETLLKDVNEFTKEYFIQIQKNILCASFCENIAQKLEITEHISIALAIGRLSYYLSDYALSLNLSYQLSKKEIPHSVWLIRKRNSSSTQLHSFVVISLKDLHPSSLPETFESLGSDETISENTLFLILDPFISKTEVFLPSQYEKQFTQITEIPRKKMFLHPIYNKYRIEKIKSFVSTCNSQKLMILSNVDKKIIETFETNLRVFAQNSPLATFKHLETFSHDEKEKAKIILKLPSNPQTFYSYQREQIKLVKDCLEELKKLTQVNEGWGFNFASKKVWLKHPNKIYLSFLNKELSAHKISSMVAFTNLDDNKHVDQNSNNSSHLIPFIQIRVTEERLNILKTMSPMPFVEGFTPPEFK